MMTYFDAEGVAEIRALAREEILYGRARDRTSDNAPAGVAEMEALHAPAGEEWLRDRVAELSGQLASAYRRLGERSATADEVNAMELSERKQRDARFEPDDSPRAIENALKEATAEARKRDVELGRPSEAVERRAEARELTLEEWDARGAGFAREFRQSHPAPGIAPSYQAALDGDQGNVIIEGAVDAWVAVYQDHDVPPSEAIRVEGTQLRYVLDGLDRRYQQWRDAEELAKMEVAATFHPAGSPESSSLLSGLGVGAPPIPQPEQAHESWVPARHIIRHPQE